MKNGLLILIVLFVSGCMNPEERFQGSILAEVGDDFITAEEFQLNYEFGHAHLRSGLDPKRDYLYFMLYESVMAQEAKKLRLDTLADVRYPMSTLEEELLIERVFDEKVLAHIEVTEEEIRSEINKMAVRFQFQFMPASGRQDAEFLYNKIVEQGYDAALEERKSQFPELSAIEQDLSSPYVKADEIDSDLLDILKDLELNTPSLPVEYRGSWYVFQVNDIRQERLSPEDYLQKAPTYEKVIYNRKALQEGGKFVAQLMEPLSVSTKREGFTILEDVLWAWYSEAPPTRNLTFYIKSESSPAPYISRLVQNYQVPLVQFGDDLWTIEDFISAFTPGRYIIPVKDRKSFTARFADIVALVVRDAQLLDIADRERLHEDLVYERTMNLWRHHWLSQAYKKVLREDSTIKWNAQAFADHADALLNEYDVLIRWDLLDSLHVSISEKDRSTTVHLLKSNSNRRPFPIVDPSWIQATTD